MGSSRSCWDDIMTIKTNNTDNKDADKKLDK